MDTKICSVYNFHIMKQSCFDFFLPFKNVMLIFSSSDIKKKKQAVHIWPVGHSLLTPDLHN